MARLRGPAALLAWLGAAEGATGAEWVEEEMGSADMAYTLADQIHADSLALPDGGLRIVTFWARPDRIGLPLPSQPNPQNVGRQIVRCVTDLGPDLELVSDRCWTTRP